jgi:hypothetical protein
MRRRAFQELLDQRAKYRSDSAGEPFEAGISRHGPTSQYRVCPGQTVFSRDLQHRPTPAGEFELYYDL